MWQDALLLEVNEAWVALDVINDEAQLPPGIRKLLDTLSLTSSKESVSIAFI